MSSNTSLTAFASFGVASLASSLFLKARVRALHTAPRCARRPHVVKFGKHGPNPAKLGADVAKLMDPPIERVDDLFWLRDDTRKNPEVLDHLRAENTYAATLTSHLTAPGGPVDRLYEEFRGRMKETDSGMPTKRGPFNYFSRTFKGKSYPVHCRAIAAAATTTAGGNKAVEEEILLDENEVAQGHHMCDIHAVEETDDHGLLAYSVDYSGYETYDIRFRALKYKAVFPAGVSAEDSDLDVVGVAAPASMDEDARKHLESLVIHNTNGDIEWGPEVAYTNNEGKAVKSRSLFYLSMDSEHRPYRLWRHVVGRPQQQDECLFEEKDERFWLGISTSQSGDFLFVTSASKITSEIFAVPFSARGVAALTKAGAKPAVHVKGAVPDVEEHDEDEDEEEDGDAEGKEEEGEETGEESGDEKDEGAGDGAPMPLLQLIAKRQDDVLYEVEHYRAGSSTVGSKGAESDIFVVVTNKDGATNFKIAFAPIAELAKGFAAWREVLPHSKELYVTDVSVFSSFWAISGRIGGYENVWVVAKPDVTRSIASNGATPLKLSKLPAREGVFTLSVGGGNASYHASTLRFIYSSPVTPTLSCEVAITDKDGNPAPSAHWSSGPIKSASGEETDPLAPLPAIPQDGTILVLKQKPVPNVDTSLYRTARVFAPSKDGKTKIPVSVVIRPDRHAMDPAAAEKLFSNATSDDVPAPIVEPAPVFLQAYGSYGYPYDPNFSAHVLSLCDRGVVYALAHIRGGSEMGRHWYEKEGKLLTKRNTFDDFCAVADHLIAKGWTKKGKIGAQGGSAGGMLMGVVANERPELFGAVLAEVPFVDCLTTMADPSIPLTIGEWEEWGNPNEEASFHYMASYSPMDNVKRQQYPPMLLEGGLNDSRVAYWEPAKFAQRLRDVNIPSFVNANGKTTKEEQHNTILLKTEMDEGHAGAADRYKYLKEKAFSWSWLLDKLGVKV